jgi:hypothetical protein
LHGDGRADESPGEHRQHIPHEQTQYQIRHGHAMENEKGPDDELGSRDMLPAEKPRKLRPWLQLVFVDGFPVILVQSIHPGGKSGPELIVVSTETQGGNPLFTGLSVFPGGALSLDPDGSCLAFVGGVTRQELWTITNLLPKFTQETPAGGSLLFGFATAERPASPMRKFE